jgi:tetratricopeptide (TPR) repeat protein
MEAPAMGANALGYRLLGEGRSAQAIQAFRINTRAYPNSANAFDSLGEALAAAGERAAAIAGYRRALELQPGFRALRRQTENQLTLWNICSITYVR